MPPTFCQQIETVHHKRTVKSVIVISGICKGWQPDSGHPPTVTLPQSPSHSHPLTNHHIIGSLSALIVPRSPESRYFEPYCLPLLPLLPLLPKVSLGAGAGELKAKKLCCNWPEVGEAGAGLLSQSARGRSWTPELLQSARGSCC